MRKIAIVGAGQAGLQLALGLQKHGYEVTLLSNRTANEIRAGKVTSSQIMFDRAMQTERDLGIDLWQEQTPQVTKLGITVGSPIVRSMRIIDWSAEFERPAQSVDQRVKASGWMELFVSRGGQLRILDAGLSDLEDLGRTHDLVIVAAGKGDIVKHFERDASRSAFEKPQRILGLFYVNGMVEHADTGRGCVEVAPAVGEYVTFPALTTSGPCDIMLFEGIPGRPMDCWNDIRSPEEYLTVAKGLLKEFFPWQFDRCQNIQLTDNNGAIAGRVTPTVRKGVATLPSGLPVLGIGDVVVVNDPLSGQGANSAALSADLYMKKIIEHGAGAFDIDWMNRTFEQFWAYARYVADFTETLLTGPQVLATSLLNARNDRTLAKAFAVGFNDPRTLAPWLIDEASVPVHPGTL
jgi:hypothetical protein